MFEFFALSEQGQPLADDQLTIQGLTKRLRMQARDVRSGVLELVVHDLVEVLKVRLPEGKGISSVHRLSPQVLADLQSGSIPLGNHVERRMVLFSGAEFLVEVTGLPAQRERASSPDSDKRVSPITPKGRLSFLNRVLLGVLLAHADEFGYVSGLDSKDLQALTGFDANSLKHRIQRLVALGLIRCVLPGCSSSIFQTSKRSSSYYLNLNHPGYAGIAHNAVFISFWPGDPPRGPFDLLEQDVRRVRKRSHALLKRPELAFKNYATPEGVLRYLVRAGPSAMSALREIFYRGAAQLLMSSGFEVVTHDVETTSYLSGLLKSELQHVPSTGDYRDSVEWLGVLAHFSGVIIKIANDSRDRLMLLETASFKGLSLCFLPVKKNVFNEVITVLLSKAPGGCTDCTMVSAYKKGECDVLPLAQEQEFDCEIRLRAGLLSPPSKRVTGYKT